MVVIRAKPLADLLNISYNKVYYLTKCKRYDCQFKHRNIRYITKDYAKCIARYFANELSEPLNEILQKIDDFKP